MPCIQWTKGGQAKELRRFLQGLNLPAICFHDLRATWATIMLCKGVEPIKAIGDPKVLQDLQTLILEDPYRGDTIAGTGVLGVSSGTIRSWEQDQKSPSQAARRLMEVFEVDPSAFAKIGNKKAG